MSKKETDILLIRKYLKGELDARAMHQLERRAQDDPFLMDALEGYEAAGTDQQPVLDELSARLLQRITKKEKRIIPYRMLAIAASILMVFTVGWLWLSNEQQPMPRVANKVTVPAAAPVQVEPAVKDTVPVNHIAANKPVARVQSHRETLRAAAPAIISADAQSDKLAEVKAENPDNDTVTDDTTPLNEMVVMDYAAQQQKKKETLAKARKGPPANAEKLLQARVADATNTPASATSDIFMGQQYLFRGRVVDKQDGSPLPGVSVRVPGTAYGTVTDADGKFVLRVDSVKNTNLLIAYVGYKAEQVNTRNHDSVNTISLQPSANSLSEVVVTRSGTKKNDGTTTPAHPQTGWGSYKKYLNENAVSPDGKKGVVKLSFMVDRNGGISEIIVVKGLSPAANKKAIDLLDNGPEWVGNSTGQPEKVTLRVKFGK